MDGLEEIITRLVCVFLLLGQTFAVTSLQCKPKVITNASTVFEIRPTSHIY